MKNLLAPYLTDGFAVLFDLGGVLFPDPWETITLTPAIGLVDRLGIDRSLAEAAGSALWPHFSQQQETEDAWWDAFGRAVGLKISRDLVIDVSSQVLLPLSAGLSLLAEARSTGLRLGVITDNTAFWFSVQARALDLDAWASPGLRYASYERGVGKKNGLFDLAAHEMDTSHTLVIDDRKHNLDRAASCGFRTFLFCGNVPQYKGHLGSPRPAIRKSVTVLDARNQPRQRV